MKPLAALWKFAVVAAMAVLLLILLTNIMEQPVDSATRPYTAEFTDASGLHLGADVRVRGVRVGKVDSIELERRDGRSVAAIDFSLERRYAVVSTTRLAIKYQALTGLRYIDVLNPAEVDTAEGVVTHVPTAMTQPSLDITTLFNGLQPVLATLTPEEINVFTENTANYLNGDGRGLGPMLESIRKLTQFATDRQQVVATLMQNLSALADAMGGHSKDFIQVLEWVNRPVDAALKVLDEFRKSDLYGPEFTSAAANLIHNFGFQPGVNIDDAMDRAITAIDDNMDAFKRVPVIWENIGPPTPPGEPVPCSRGPAQLPASMDVLLNGQRVILCNR